MREVVGGGWEERRGWGRGTASAASPAVIDWRGNQEERREIKTIENRGGRKEGGRWEVGGRSGGEGRSAL